MSFSTRIFSLFAFIPLFFGAGCSQSSPPADPSVLRVGLDPTYPPFEMRDAAGNLTGVSIDLAQAIGNHLDKKVEFVPMDFQGLLPALQTGKIDLIISSMTATDERAKQVAFSTPYVENGLCLLVPASSTLTGIEGLDVPGKTVVVRTGTTGHLYAVKNIRQAKVIPQELSEACANEVINGNVDAFLYDQLSVLEYAARHPDKVKALARPFQKEPWAVAMRKSDTALLEKVNGALTALNTSGPLLEAFDKYPVLKERRAQLAAQGQPFIFLTAQDAGK